MGAGERLHAPFPTVWERNHNRVKIVFYIPHQQETDSMKNPPQVLDASSCRRESDVHGDNHTHFDIEDDDGIDVKATFLRMLIKLLLLYQPPLSVVSTDPPLYLMQLVLTLTGIDVITRLTYREEAGGDIKNIDPHREI